MESDGGRRVSRESAVVESKSGCGLAWLGLVQVGFGLVWFGLVWFCLVWFGSGQIDWLVRTQ